MDFLSLIPKPDPIPVAWGWFEVLLVLVFVLHLLFINSLAGTLVISFVGHLKGNPAEGTEEMGGGCHFSWPSQ